MIYQLEYTKDAEKYLQKIPQNYLKRIKKKIENLAINPFPLGFKDLKGVKYEGVYRIKVGDYRILYEVLQNELIILVIDVGPRGGVYR